MKNLIVLFKDKKYEINNIEEAINLFFDEEYINLSNEEKVVLRYKKAFGICKLKNIDLVDTKIGTLGDNGIVIKRDYDILKSFIIDNEKTYMLSLCKFYDMVILEKKDSNILNNSNITNIDEADNYVVINKFVNELLLINLK